MKIYYLDESADSKTVVSALGVPDMSWNQAFDRLKKFRAGLRELDGIRIAKELHASDFVAGRGSLGSRIVPKGRRVVIFRELLSLIGEMHDLGVECINAYLDSEELALDRVINRIQRSLEVRNDFGILVFDSGNEIQTRKALRRMRVFNPVPSKFTKKEERSVRNVPISRIIADPFFRKSSDDYFLQVVDFTAFACLRRLEPTGKVTKYGLENAFLELEPILNKDAHREDPMGIVRK